MQFVRTPLSKKMSWLKEYRILKSSRSQLFFNYVVSVVILCGQWGSLVNSIRTLVRKGKACSEVMMKLETEACELHSGIIK